MLIPLSSPHTLVSPTVLERNVTESKGKLITLFDGGVCMPVLLPLLLSITSFDGRECS